MGHECPYSPLDPRHPSPPPAKRETAPPVPPSPMVVAFLVFPAFPSKGEMPPPFLPLQEPPPPLCTPTPTQVGQVQEGAALAKGDTYAGVSSIGWREFAIKEEILKAIQEAGWEHPSEVQQQSIPKSVAGADVICQAKAGRGKTGVFVISILQQLDVVQVEDGTWGKIGRAHV